MQCTNCGSEMKQIPAGISKTTGRAYDAFMACPNKCGRPAKAQKKETDWDAIAKGKVRCALLCAMIQAGWKTDDMKTKILGLEAFVLGTRVEKKSDPIPTIQVEEDPLADVPF